MVVQADDGEVDESFWANAAAARAQGDIGEDGKADGFSMASSFANYV